MLCSPRAVALLALVTLVWWHDVGRSQTPAPTIDPSVCAGLQQAMNDMVAVSLSDSLTDEQKIEALAKAWNKAWRGLQSQGETTADAAAVLKGLGQAMAQLMAKALSASQSPRDPVSPQLERELNELKQRTMPFVALMKLICPDLVLPEILTK